MQTSVGMDLTDRCFRVIWYCKHPPPPPARLKQVFSKRLEVLGTLYVRGHVDPEPRFQSGTSQKLSRADTSPASSTEPPAALINAHNTS